MSGGVDSSVAAALLQERGFNVIGAHIRGFNIDGCGEKDAEDARRVAEQLKIPFYVFDLEKEYKEKVVDYMIDGYRRGLTPNPDVICNKEIKFGLFFKRALKLGADFVATGHYVRLIEPAGGYFYENQNNFFPAKKFSSPSATKTPLRRGTKLLPPAGRSLRNSRQLALVVAKDKNKDQSYFLWTLTQKQLKHCLFPIGDYTKSQVRRLAKKFNLLTADKKDSQGICFLGKITLTDFLKQYIPERRGLVLDVAGEKIGEHRGAHFYTIGQRHGFGVGMRNKELGIKNIEPCYVSAKNIKNNILIVAEGGNNPVLYKKEINLVNANFINPIPDTRYPIFVFVRVRYRQPLFRATLTNADNTRNYAENASKNIESLLRRSAFKSASVRVLFDKEQKFIAPGQSAVFYDRRGQMLGGGVIIY